MPANMMKALVGSRLKVTGRRIATVSAGPIPGSTPTAVPTVTPAKAQNKKTGLAALANPCPSSVSVSNVARLQPPGQYAGRKRKIQQPSEQ